MTRYARELRITINDMYGGYHNVPDYSITHDNGIDRSVGIHIRGRYNNHFREDPKFNFYGFIQKLENSGWIVLTMKPVNAKFKLFDDEKEMLDDLYLSLEVRKIEDIDIESDIKIVTCDFCEKPRTYTHKSGLEVCKDHRDRMLVKPELTACSCQEAGEDCCATHSKEPDVGVFAVNPKIFEKFKKQED